MAGARTRRRRAVLLAVAATVVVACTDAPSRPSPPTRLLGTDRYFTAFAVGDRLVTGRTGPTPERPLDEFATTAWELVDPATGAVTPLRLPDSTGCTKTSYHAGFALGGGEVGFSRVCVEGQDDDLVAYDLATRRVRVLVHDPEPAQYVVLGDGDILASHDSSFCTYLARYRDGKAVPVGITLERDGWPLDAMRPPGATECKEYGLVSSPAVSRTGELAFVASTAARGRTGNRRVRSEAGLYVVEGGVARRVATAPGRPRALTWNAAGDTLLVAVEGRHAGVHAVTRDGEVERLTSVLATDVAAFDGFLVVVEDPGGDDDLSLLRRLVRVELPAR